MARLRVAPRLSGVLLLGMMVLLAGCTRAGSRVGAGAGVDDVRTGVSTRNPALINEVIKEEAPPMGPVADPVEGPVNLPPVPRAPATVVEPAGMQVRALATTNTNMPVPGLGTIKTTIIRARVTWTPVKGAAGYKVYQLAMREGGAADTKGKLALSTPHWLPMALVGGGMGFSNLNVGQEYLYTVEALDRAGNVIGRGQDNCAPLAPLEIPYLQEPAQHEANVGATPYFRWKPSNGADGYYVEVFGTMRGVVPAMPMWRGFRSNPESMNMLYGQQVDVFEGTRPLQWSLPLNLGSRYAWTVCAIRTDTHNMHNAKAIARATASFNYFTP